MSAGFSDVPHDLIQKSIFFEIRFKSSWPWRFGIEKPLIRSMHFIKSCSRMF